MEATQSKVMEILNREVSLTGGQAVAYDTSLRVDAELDSLDLSVFFLAIQEEYDVEVTDEDAAQLDSVNAIVEWLNGRIQ